MSNPDAETVKKQIRAEQDMMHADTRTEAIEAGRVRDYLATLGKQPAESLIAVGKPAPRLFLLTLARTRRPGPRTGNAVNAGNELEFLAPVLIGDLITVRRQVTGVEERHGARGRLFICHTQSTFDNQHGVRVAIGRQRIIYFGR